MCGRVVDGFLIFPSLFYLVFYLICLHSVGVFFFLIFLISLFTVDHFLDIFFANFITTA